MRDGRYGEQLARRSVAELAATTDEELAADIRAAATALLAAVAERRARGGWPESAFEVRAHNAAVLAVRAVAELAPEAPLLVLTRAVAPALGEWWPASPAVERPLFETVERLRVAALHRPGVGLRRSRCSSAEVTPMKATPPHDRVNRKLTESVTPEVC
ncbi:hypothetical protein ACWKSP_35935 [Micromonosporaceae bacterium Da 78-11]